MRLAAIGAALVTIASANATEVFPQRIDLNQPGALEQLQQTRPKHFEAITGVLRVAERLPCKAGQFETLKVRFDVRDLACNFIVLTSYPPKRRINFRLDETSYVALVTLKDTEGKLVPAQK